MSESEPDREAAEGRLMQLLLQHGIAQPEADGLICGDEKLNWGDLRARVLNLAGAITARSGQDTGRIALLGDISADLVIAYLAAIAAGQCAVPLQTSLKPEALADMLRDCSPDLLFVGPDYVEAADGLPVDQNRLVVLDQDGIERFLAGIYPLPAPVEISPEAPFNIIYSSGTTGRPKGIVQSHAMRYRQATRTLFSISPRSTMLLATPLYSNTTLMPLLMTLVHGGRAVMMRKFDAEGYLDLAEKFGATHTMLVPVQYQRILNAGSFSGRDLSRFEVKQSTGAPLPAEAKRRVAQDWPGRFLEVYGLTEGGCTCILDVTRYPDKVQTVGRPAQNNDIRIIDDDGQDVPLGERGEIVGRSPMMMSGYLNNPEATEAFYWRDADGTVYHRTGDIGVFDADGFLTLVDRKKDVIISGGFNVYASDLEDILIQHPEVAEATVIGIPSEKWGETPLGLVVAKPDATLVPSDLLEWANVRLGKMQRLSTIELRPELPRSAVGKVLKQDLKRPYWENKQ